MSQANENQKTWLEKRSALKKAMVTKVKEDKAKKAARKVALAEMDDGARKEAQAADRQAKQTEKAAFKERIKSAEKAERKALKQERRMYKKIKNRPRRFTLWGIAAAVVVFAVVKVGPTVKDMAKVMSGNDINLTSDTEGAAKAREHGGEVAEKISNEGIILLKNEDKHLPLQNKKVNVFGVSAFEFRYGGGGSGGSDTSRAISLFDGLENGGLEVNQDLVTFYEGLDEVQGKDEKTSSGLIEVAKSMVAGSADDEPEIAYLTDEAIKQAQDFSDNAIIVISSSGVESSDMSTEELVLSANKRELIKKVSENFENITIVVNSGNTIELGFVEEFPQIKSVVWVGTPGPFGTNSLGKTLSGELNPSGRTTDTYAYSNDSAPATENFGDYQYDNLKQAFVNYQEGIYIGYRFYETIYGEDEVAYKEAVQYPFGYGLSYTDFKWNVVKEELNEDKIALTVEVENTGDVAGKDVVQVYYSAPYMPGGIEKSAIELGNYSKTDLLAPGEKQTVEIEFNTRDMASYDEKDAQAYVLDKGKYEIKLAKNVHDVVETLDYDVKEKVVFKEDADTKTPYENKFTRSDGGVEYLSRNDWEGTYPSDKDLNHTAPDFVLEELAAVPEDSKLEMPKVEQDNGLKLADLKGLAKDDQKWDLFMDQFSIEEMMDFTADGAYSTNQIERLGVPQAVLLDGPAGINFFFKTIEAAAYPTEVVLASTWNNDLAYEMGEAVGLESRELGVHGWYAPGMNLHRTPHGGRNFEYFSEDPVISGKMASNLISGGQDQGIIVFMKHFAMNDQETNARSGLYVWANEQSMRELHLKPFEMAVKEANVLGTMSSFSMLNGTWAGGNSILLNDILRDEWGFDGFVSTDAVFGFMHANKAVVNGNDLMLDIMSLSKNKKRLKEAYKQDPSGTAIGLRTSTKNVLYTYLQTYLFE